LAEKENEKENNACSANTNSTVQMAATNYGTITRLGVLKISKISVSPLVKISFLTHLKLILLPANALIKTAGEYALLNNNCQNFAAGLLALIDDENNSDEEVPKHLHKKSLLPWMPVCAGGGILDLDWNECRWIESKYNSPEAVVDWHALLNESD
jgi:hypothetical protein